MFEGILAAIASALDSAGIPYMVIGGQAVLLYGEPRLTRDIDITLGAGLEKLAEVVRAAHAAGLDPLVDPESFTRETMVLPCEHRGSGIRIDLILSFSEYERLALERARTVRLGSTDVRFASVEDIVIGKVIAGRPRDLEDVRTILLKNPAIDERWILKWLREFESTVSEPLVTRFQQAKEGID